jgi:hypothetical protein
MLAIFCLSWPLDPWLNVLCLASKLWDVYLGTNGNIILKHTLRQQDIGCADVATVVLTVNLDAHNQLLEDSPAGLCSIHFSCDNVNWLKAYVTHHCVQSPVSVLAAFFLALLIETLAMSRLFRRYANKRRHTGRDNTQQNTFSTSSNIEKR